MLHDQINPIELGEKLRLARETNSITQAHAAGHIDVARTTLVAIEKGQRKIKLSELKKLADLYSTSVNTLMREEAVHVDLVPRFRRQVTSHSDLGEDAANVMSQLAKAQIELENILGIKHNRNYPPERPILPGDVVKQADQDALELRQWLSLGHSPIQDIMSIIELDLGIRLFIKKLDSKISGLFAHEESIGACILINANHRKDRRAHTAAHELGHFIGTRKVPEIYFSDDPFSSREEKYADAFARSFLMPSRAILSKFKEITAGANNFTRRHIIIIAHTFGVSREAVVRRLEELQAVKKGTWNWFNMNGGITDQQVAEVLGDRATNNRDQAQSERPTTFRLNALICQAWQDGLLSEGQLTKLVGVSRYELRAILDDHDLDGSEADNAPSFFD